MTVHDVLLATRSAGKLLELRPLFDAHGVRVIDLDDAGIPESAAEDQLEAYETFEENALAKARHFHRLSGRPTIADDSGLVVDALGGQPGVHSKRWSGRDDLRGIALDEENNRRLLERLRGVADRRAHYVCVAAYVDGDRELTFRGEVHGRIVDDRGGPSGFGYDPYFHCDELGRTFGDATREDKELVSHRGRAFRGLIAALEGVGRMDREGGR
ncbi:MAG TPA: RdgB/HAM1 family non-canonical purine NTP pyrophosphatase [Polyangiaceae bacterium]|nr:RdgB/HAM1 family non-canonical purine NTP pyrophosphatase [Polyangiaceae bacterium]